MSAQPVADLGTVEIPAPGLSSPVLRAAIDGRQISLALEPVQIRGDQFRARVDLGGTIIEHNTEPSRSLRGVSPDGAVFAGSFTDDGLRGVLFPAGAQGGMWDVIPGNHPGTVIFTEAVSPFADGHICGADHDHGELPLARGGGSGGLPLEAEIAIEIDYPMFISFGPRTRPEISIQYAEDLVNAVDVIYERDTNISLKLTDILVRTNSADDPYVGTDSGSLLSQFRDEWNTNQGAVQRDLAHLLSGREFDGSVIGVAYVGVVCTGSAYGVNQKLSSFASMTALLAHESGHNWSAGHCNGDPDCHIMCSGLGGCDGFGNPIQFASGPIAEITNHAASRTCIDIPPATLPLADDFENGSFDVAVWNETTNASIVPDAGATSPSSVAEILPGGTLVTRTIDHDDAAVLTLEVLSNASAPTLFIEARSGGRWILLETVAPSAFAQSVSVQISRGLIGGDTPVRLRTASTGTSVRIDDFLVADAPDCLADVNMDGQVTPTDFGAWLAAFNAGDPAADQNQDGQITPTDFGAWLANFNAGCN